MHNGGYETTRTVEAKTESNAWKKAEKKYGGCVYGAMNLRKVELIEE